jgi:hypothetical protein
MEGRFTVTGGAGGRKSAEIAAPMTAFTGQPGMGARQREATQIVIESGRLPGRGRMAECTIRPKATLMRFIRPVAGNAFRRGAFERQRLMAIATGYLDMRAGQWETTPAMVESGRLPPRRRMTGLALGHLTLMGIVLAMAAKAIHRRTLEHAVLVTAFTGHLLVLPGQLEGGQIVVEGGRLPPRGRMTGLAIRPKTTLMGIVLLVTGDTRSRRHLEVGNGARPTMTPFTAHRRMFPLQREASRMHKPTPKPVHSIMAGQTIVPICLDVAGHPAHIPLPMAVLTGGHVKRLQSLRVTIRTGKRLTVCFLLMRRQRKTHRFVGEILHGDVGQRRIRPLVLGMAGPAGDARIALIDRTMQALGIALFDGDSLVASQAAVVHASLLPGRNMAGLTFAADHGMRGYAAQGWPFLCVQGTGIEEHAPLGNGNAGNHQGSDQAGQ